MEFADLIRARRMTRAFSSEPVAPDLLEEILDLGRRVPSAGNTQGFDLVVLVGAEETARYWDVSLPAGRRSTFRWKALLAAPVIVTVWADPSAYVNRYAEGDKSATGLGQGLDAWATPYWTVDSSFVALAVQLAAQDAGLGVLFFGMFDQGAAIASALGVPSGHEPIGTIAIGWPAPTEEPGRSAGRKRRSADEIIHRGGW